MRRPFQSEGPAVGLARRIGAGGLAPLERLRGAEGERMRAVALRSRRLDDLGEARDDPRIRLDWRHDEAVAAFVEMLLERRHRSRRRQRPALGIFEASRKIIAERIEVEPIGRRLRRFDRKGRARALRQRRARALLRREDAGVLQRGAMGDEAKMPFALQRRNPHSIGSRAQEILQ